MLHEGSTSVSDIAKPSNSRSRWSAITFDCCVEPVVKGARQSKQIFYEVADKHVSQVLLDMAIHIVEDNSDD